MGQWSFIKNIIKKAKGSNKAPNDSKSINKITKRLLENESNNRQLAGQVYGEHLRYGDYVNPYDTQRVLAEGKYSKERYNDLLENYSKYRNTLDEDEYMDYLRKNFSYIFDGNNMDVAMLPPNTAEKLKRMIEIINSL